MKYELRENQGIPPSLLALMAMATGLSVANCYYNQPLLGSMAKSFVVNDFSASLVATLTQIGYVVGLVFVIPLGDVISRKKLILTNYIVSACALLAIAFASNIYWAWGASLLAGASSAVHTQGNYASLLKSLLRLFARYPYLRIASLRAALAYGSFFALWSCLAFRMKQEPFFANDDIIGALGLCGLAGASTVVFISGYIQRYGARFFSIMGGCVILVSWLFAFYGNNSYLWMVIAILLIDAGMQCIHLANQTSVVSLDASAINRINTVYMTVYFLGGSAGTFVSGLSWQHFGWAGVAGVGLVFVMTSLLINWKANEHREETQR